MLRHLLRLTTLFALVITALPASLPAPRAAQAAPTPPAGSWPFFRYDMQRTNRVPPSVAKGNITQPTIKWRYPVGGAAGAIAADITGPNGVPDGVRELIVLVGNRVLVYNLDGEPIWASDLFTAPAGIHYIGDLDGDGSTEVVVRLSLGSRGVAPSWRMFVLSGASGQVRSELSGASYFDEQWYIGDLNNDGKIEMIELPMARVLPPPTNQLPIRVFSFPSADAPTVTVAISNPQSITQARLADLNGDGTPELLFVGALVGYSGNHNHCPAATCKTFYIRDRNNLNLIADFQSSTAITNGWGYGKNVTGLIVEDLTASPGAEILSVWGSQVDAGGNFAYVSLVEVSTSFSITTKWAYALTAVQESPATLRLLDLDGNGDRRVAWSYVNAADNRHRTEIANITGTLQMTYTNRQPCAQGNLIAGGGQELVLCQMSGNAVTGIEVYSGTSLSLQWSAPVSGLNWLTDFDGDGLGDLLVVEGTVPNQTLKVRRGHDGAVLHTHTPGQAFGLRTVANLDGDAAGTPEVIYGAVDGYLYILDNTLNVLGRLYAGTGTSAPYVVDTNADGKNEVILGAQGLLTNLDPYTATQQTPPTENWRRIPSLLGQWHPLDLDADGQWEYPFVDATQAPTYTLQLSRIDPLSGVATLVTSYTITNATGLPRLMAVGQFNGSGPDDLLIATGGDDALLHAVAWSGVPGTPAALAWSHFVFYDANYAVGSDLNADGREDFARTWAAGGGVANGASGALFHSAFTRYRSQPIIANLDADANDEVIFTASEAGQLTVREYSTTLLVALNTNIPGIQPSSVAVAEVDSSQPGLEIVYATQRVLGARRGITSTDIYTRGLGVLINNFTCVADLNTPFVYSGIQVDSNEANCPGAMRLARVNELIVADIDNDNQDEILVASNNGYLYALNAEDGTLLWGYNFRYPVASVRVANIDNDPQLEILASVADGYLYALDQSAFSAPLSVWDGPGPNVNFDIDQQGGRVCYVGRWQVPSPFSGPNAPDGHKVALRDQSGLLMTEGYLDVPHNGSSVVGVTLCHNDPNPQRALISQLLNGRRYFLEVISYKGQNSSVPVISDGVLVQAVGDLAQSSKTVTPTAVMPGGVVTWTVVVRNRGTAPASVEMFDPLPANTSYVAGSAVASAGTVSYEGSNNRIVWQSATPLAIGQSVVITFATQVNSSFTSGLIRNEAELVDLDTGVTTRVEAIAAVGTSNLSSAQKVVNLANAQQGSVLTYTIRVTNTGALTATGTLVEDPLPAGVTYVAGSLSSSGGNGSASYDSTGNRVLWTGSLAAGEWLTVTFAATVAITNGLVDNCAQVRDAQSGSFQRCARTVVGTGGRSLATSLKTSDRTIYNPGDPIVYTITLRNDGTQDATVAMDDVMPAGVTVNSASVDPNVGSLSFTPNRVQWNGPLPAGNTVNVTIFGTVTASAGVLNNVARVTETVSGQVYTLTRAVQMAGSPLINAQKFAEPPNVAPNGTITYVLRLENVGGAVAANAVLSDPLPANTSYVPGSALANVGVVTYNAGAGRLEWSGPIYITQTTVITWQVKVGLLTPIGTQIVNQAFSFDGVGDRDQMAATTLVNGPFTLYRAYLPIALRP